MRIDPSSLPHRDTYFLLTGIVVPRPIALVSSLSAEGIVNAAPFSFFNAVTANPPTIMISVDRRAGNQKDTTRNILSLKEFVVNVVTEEIAEKMNIASGNYPPDVSEIDLAGLTTIPSETISVPRIAESPIQLECRLSWWKEIGNGPNDLIFGEITAIHLDDRIMKEGRIDHAALKAVGRLSGSYYCTTTGIFRMQRPK